MTISTKKKIALAAVLFLVINIYLLLDTRRSLYREAIATHTATCTTADLIYLSKFPACQKALKKLTLRLAEEDASDYTQDSLVITAVISQFEALELLKIEIAGGLYIDLLLFPKDIARLQKLTTIDLRDNTLMGMPFDIKQFYNLQFLDLRGNTALLLNNRNVMDAIATQGILLIEDDAAYGKTTGELILPKRDLMN